MWEHLSALLYVSATMKEPFIFPNMPHNLVDSYSQLDLVPRQYAYNTGAHTIVPFLDPLVILASLAFFAFIIQTFHALYLSHHTVASPNPSLLGGLVDSLVPTKHRTLQLNDQHFKDILATIQLYKVMHGKHRNRPSKTSIEQKEEKSTVLIPINSTFPYSY